ncbi:DUF3558 domain-containing protein [Streptomyces sp. NPDC127084]|uniref:DUF3558 domain-containing protein n=1 Tax=Streptomyces sp. NPDC127084 TaxID=3347133 RepID=UPI00366A00D0
MHRSAPRLTRILACAAVPVMLVVAGCSSDSDSENKSDKTSKSGNSPGSSSQQSPASKESAATVAPAKYAKLPAPCKSLSAKTVEGLVPKVKNKAGTEGTSSDTTLRSGCSWNGLEDKGVKGSNYRWLDVSFLRYESDASLGSGEQRAQEAFKKEAAKTAATDGAKKVAKSPATGVGDEATAIAFELKKTDVTFKYATVVARTGNIVVTLGYNGAGYAGAKSPAAADLMKGAVKAAKEAAAAVATANK